MYEKLVAMSSMYAEQPQQQRSPGPATPTATKPPKTTASLTTPAAKRKRVSESAKAVGYHVGFIGSGNMARALAEGMIASGD